MSLKEVLFLKIHPNLDKSKKIIIVINILKNKKPEQNSGFYKLYMF